MVYSKQQSIVNILVRGAERPPFFTFARMESVRQQKVSRLLQKEISVLFQNELYHMCSGNMVTVTVVRIAPDLGFAKIYVSIFPAQEPAEIVREINERVGEVTRSLYPKIKNQFRKMPEIRFYHDDSLDYADRIDQILPN